MSRAPGRDRIRAAVIYARTASARLEDQASADEQVALCRGLAELEGWNVAEVFVDRGASGLTLARPGLRRALEHITGHRVDALLCQSATRLARDRRVLGDVAARLAERGVRLVYAAPDGGKQPPGPKP